jgi:BioD-like phosphotransacetylase family protein
MEVYVSVISTLVLIIISLISFIYVADRRKAAKEREEILTRIDKVEGHISYTDDKVEGVVKNYLDRFQELKDEFNDKITPIIRDIATLLQRTRHL